uniref:Regulator of microtubule dynamics protein 1 n=1 Tax=Esox lucius TaxID=8010 RepID=A0A6Q2X572_ESOLU
MTLGAHFLRCSARNVLSVPGCKTVNIRGHRRQHWTTFRNITSTTTVNSIYFTLVLKLSTVTIKVNIYHIQCQLYCVLAEEVVEQADYLYSCGETEKLYQLLLQYKDSDDAEFLWRLARASRDVSLLAHIAANEKKRLTYEAFEYTKKALEKNDACFAAHKWFAVCLSDIGDYEGVKVKIGNSYIIKKHLERAIELNPKDATSIHILGYWCFAFAELAWYQRKVAAMIFASPPTATYEEALAFFLKAEEVDPNFYSMNLLMLGKTYLAMKDTEKAVHWLSKAKEYPPHTEEDKQVHKEALDLLRKIGA